jgi:hypothetical protein
MKLTERRVRWAETAPASIVFSWLRRNFSPHAADRIIAYMHNGVTVRDAIRAVAKDEGVKLGQKGPGYDMNLRSMPPFMYVERHTKVGDLGVIAFGAYNAMGLIGTEKGGIAIVLEKPPEVIATKDIPWNPVGRLGEAREVEALIRSFAGAKNKQIPQDRREDFLVALRDRGYGVRWL